jgi:hypothetical protein
VEEKKRTGGVSSGFTVAVALEVDKQRRRDRKPVAELELMVIELVTSLQDPMRDQGTN